MNRIGFILLIISVILTTGCYYDVEEELYPNGNCDTTQVKYLSCAWEKAKDVNRIRVMNRCLFIMGLIFRSIIIFLLYLQNGVPLWYPGWQGGPHHH